MSTDVDVETSSSDVLATELSGAPDTCQAHLHVVDFPIAESFDALVGADLVQVAPLANGLFPTGDFYQVAMTSNLKMLDLAYIFENPFVDLNGGLPAIPALSVASTPNPVIARREIDPTMSTSNVSSISPSATSTPGTQYVSGSPNDETLKPLDELFAELGEAAGAGNEP